VGLNSSSLFPAHKRDTRFRFQFRHHPKTNEKSSHPYLAKWICMFNGSHFPVRNDDVDKQECP
ncbi:hypothetical protein CCACVL1_20148, partial [Corchorus capsularis]